MTRQKLIDSMTDAQIIEMWLNETEINYGHMTEKEELFYMREGDISDREEELYLQALELKPGSIEYAVKNCNCSIEEMKTAQKVIKAIRDTNYKNSKYRNHIEFDYETSAEQLLQLITRNTEKGT